MGCVVGSTNNDEEVTAVVVVTLMVGTRELEALSRNRNDRGSCVGAEVFTVELTVLCTVVRTEEVGNCTEKVICVGSKEPGAALREVTGIT